jgi:hypothetical protein
LSIWGTGSSLSHIYGSTPTTLQVFAFLGGAVLGFALVSVLAFKGVSAEFGSPANSIELWGAFHFLSVGVAVGGASLVANLSPSALGWPLGGALATALYVLLVGAEHSAADLGSSEDETA